MEASKEIGVAIGKLKRVFRDNLYKRNIETTSGKLNFLALHKYKTSKKLFQKPVELGGKRYNIELLVDNSGSMYRHREERAEPAYEAAHYLCKVLGPLTNMNVTLFNLGSNTMSWKEFHRDMVETGHDRNNYNTMYGDKKIGDDTYRIERELHGKYSRTYRGAHGNWEIVDILEARDRLSKCEGEKIIIMIVDGEPSSDFHDPENSSPKLFRGKYCLNNYPRKKFRETVEEIIAKGTRVIVFGVDYNPRNTYPVGVEISNPLHVIDHIVAIMQKLMKK